MTVTAAYRVPESGTHEENEGGQVTYTETWQVETDDVDDGQITVLAYASLPQLGASFAVGNDSDTRARVTRRRPRRIKEQPKYWRVEIHYTYRPTDPKWSGEAGSIIGLLPEVEGFGIPYSKLAIKDINDKAIVNTAGLPFDPPPEMDDCRQGVRWSRWVETCPQGNAKTFRNAINNEELWPGKAWVVPKHCAKVASYGWRRQYLEDALLFHETVELHIQETPWYLDVANLSLYKAIHEGGLTASAIIGVERITDDNGVPIDEPVFLDDDGNQQAWSDEPNYRTFHVYTESGFAVLDVPALDITL